MNIEKHLKSKAISLRKHIIEMIYSAGSGHPGGSLSAVDVITALYFHEMKIDPKNPSWEQRDRFILSKGCGCPALYAALGEKGYFSKDEFKGLRKIGAMLQGHPDRLKTPGVEMNTGSLGQGLSAGVGIALAGKYLKRDFRVFAMIGDGELNEGLTWEALMSAGHFKLDNLCIILDYNKLQSDNWCKNIMALEPLVDKFKAFNLNALEIDGHNFTQIIDAFKKARSVKDIPTIIIAHTVKGKGVSFMENVPKWHGSLAPTDEEFKQAMGEFNEGC